MNPMGTLGGYMSDFGPNEIWSERQLDQFFGKPSERPWDMLDYVSSEITDPKNGEITITFEAKPRWQHEFNQECDRRAAEHEKERASALAMLRYTLTGLREAVVAGWTKEWRRTRARKVWCARTTTLAFRSAAR
jgi:hypothetical protein